jgi:hypothetical protein
MGDNNVVTNATIQTSFNVKFMGESLTLPMHESSNSFLFLVLVGMATGGINYYLACKEMTITFSDDISTQILEIMLRKTGDTHQQTTIQAELDEINGNQK